MISKLKYVFCFFIALPAFLHAQPGNYWTNSFSTEASLLSGAVVGGNAEITAIFYNPAGISDIEESRIDLNASLFNLEHKKYKNPLGTNTEMENWFFRVYPRFVSYLFQSKKVKNLSFQIAVFNRNSTKTSIYNRVRLTDTQLGDPSYQGEYTGLFDLSSQYDDYWGSFGISKRLNQSWSFGMSFNISVQSVNYLRAATANIAPLGGISDSVQYSVSSWNTTEKLKAYNWRFIGKLGVKYKHNNWSAGLNLSLPSMRLFGNADVNKTVSQNNIYYNGAPIHDYYKNEYPQKVYFKMQEPMSVAFGIKYKSKKSTSEYYFTTEYFFAIKEYYTIDPSRKTGKKSNLGSYFSAYRFGNKDIINFAIGYKKMLTEQLGFMAGFRTDFNPYLTGHHQRFWESNGFEDLNIDLFHLTGGAKFNYRKASIVFGLQHSYGFKKNQPEFVNFSEPVNFNPETRLALQGEKKNQMNYNYNSIGIYLSFSVSF